MIELIVPQRWHDLGGFEVGRVLPHRSCRSVGPFVFLDEMGPVDFPPGLPGSVDVRPHPHIGLSTLTYLFAGEITHRDSLGNHLVISAGAVNWMTAGRGISHSERFERARREGLRLHGLQAWIALPDAMQDCTPSFTHHPQASLPAGEQGGLRWRLLAGSWSGQRSPVPTLSPLFYLHGELRDGARFVLDDEHPERAVYVTAGTLHCGDQPILTGQLARFATGGDVVLRAQGDCQWVALGGTPLGLRHIDWNFVSSSRERIEAAKQAWREGRFPRPPNDVDEFIPLPPGLHG